LAALDAPGYSIIAPVVPTIALTTGSGPAVMGALVTSFAVGLLVGYPLAGHWIRRRHAVVVLAAALVLMAIGDLGFIFSNSLPVYFASRFVQGIGAGGLWMGVTFGMLERFPDNPYPRLSAVIGAYSILRVSDQCPAGFSQPSSTGGR
jgi:MFS family permease